jgi:outer membrane receptor protein involved in Fe transport
MLNAKRLVLFLVALIFIAFLANTLIAGTTGKISGVVVDAKSGEPLPGVAIHLEGTTIGAQTNANGEYVILNIPPKIYSAKVQLISFKAKTFTDIQITADKTFKLNVELEESFIDGEDQIVVAPRDMIRIDDVQNLKIMTAEDIGAMPVQDVDQILAIQVGVVTRGGEIHIRGGRSSEVSYIVDGVETRDPLGGLGATDIGINLTSNSLQEVQIIKGGFDAEYGNVMSGVVNIVTREGDLNNTKGRFEYWTDNFRVPELNDYSFNYDRISFNMGGPEPFLSQRLLPALGIDYFEDKIAYFINIDVKKHDSYLSYNDFAPALHQRNYRTNDFLGISIEDRQHNNYQVQTKLTFNPGTGIKLTLNYTGTWDMYNRFDNSYSWKYRYTPGTAAYTEETSHRFSVTFNHQLNNTTFYELMLSRYSKEYLQIPDDPNNPGEGLYPDDFLQYNQWEFYHDANKNGRYDQPEPFINVNGDTVMFYGGDQYTQGDVMGGYAGYYWDWFNISEWWDIHGDEFYNRYDEVGWKQAQSAFDTMYWDWDQDGFIDNADGEPFVDLNGNGRWDAGDVLLWDTNGNGVFDEDRAMTMNVDKPEPYVDGDISLGEPFTDVNKNGIYDRGIDVFLMSSDPAINMDLNRNSQYDGPYDPWTPGVPYEDLNGNGLYDYFNGRYDYGEPFTDLNHNGKWDAADGFFDYGFNQWAFYQNRESITNTFDFKLIKQMFSELELKTGFQLKYRELHMADLRYPQYPYDGDPDGGPWPDVGVFRDFYDQYPYEAAFFTSFKLEFGSLIAVLGTRVDFFKQSDNIDELILEDITENKDASEVSSKVSPRVGISYPITEKAKIYFNYGHFYQLPDYQYMYRQATQASNAFGIIGNYNLDYQKNIAYSFGIRYSLSDDYILDVAGFYKDWFGLINSQEISVGPITTNEYENSDYARTRGLEVELSKNYGYYVSGTINYTYAFAYGKSSSESSNYFDQFYNRSIPIREFPLDWDVRHQLQMSFNLNISKSDKPVLFGMSIPNDWGLSVIWVYGTGYPYTPSRDYPGLRLLQGESPQSNSLRYPPNSNVDLRFHKNFTLVGLDYTFELWINNLLDKENIETVYGATGRPDTGTNIGGHVKEGSEYSNNPAFYGPGRNIRVGLALNF